MQILFLVSAYNSLSQRAWIALTDRGHRWRLRWSTRPRRWSGRAVLLPDLIVCPFLKTMIPESIWHRHRCLIVHPGPRGDRGPSSLDWAIELGMPAVGSDRAGSQRRVRRRRRLGNPDVRACGRRPRAVSIATRCGAPPSPRWSRRSTARFGAEHASPPTPGFDCGARAVMTADGPGCPGIDWSVGSARRQCCASSVPATVTPACSTRSRAALSPVRGTSGGAEWPAGRTHRSA